MIFKELCYAIVGAAFEVHRELGPGFLESVYENAMALELATRSIPFERQVLLAVKYKESPVGEYRADLLIDGKVIVELKAVSDFAPTHEAQAIHYLTATGFRLALLLNFGSQSLQFKRIVK